MTKYVKAVFLTSAFYLFLATSLSFSAATGLNIPQKLTTHTADDFQPAVSPDGKIVAFVSNRSGNNDIWLIPIDGGPARQLTTHTASDTDPSWSRDSKRLAFTSLREDSKGDIWTLDLESGKETRITDSRTAESYPSWFPDGEKMAFSRGNEVWSIDLQTGKEERLFNGYYPSVSPDGRFISYISFTEKSGGKGAIWIYSIADRKTFQLTSGEFSDTFPSWSPDGREIYFSRFSEDTNNDGVVDMKDNPSIWKIGFSDSPNPPKSPLKARGEAKGGYELQLTSGSSYELFPSATTSGIVFSAGRGKDLDIYKISKEGEIPQLKTAREQLALAYKIKEPWQAILAFRKVYLSEWSVASGQWSEEKGIFAEAQYGVALTYLKMGLKKDAVRELESLISGFKPPTPHPSSLILSKYVSLAKIELSKINAAEAASTGNKDLLLKEIKTLKEIIVEYKDQTYSQAMAQLEVGNIRLLLKDDVQALKEYELVRTQYPRETGAVAQARLRMADIYSSYGDEQKVIETYVSIIKDYPDSSEWCLTASQTVLSLIEKIGDERERLSRYREIASRHKGLPYLPALAQYKVGEFYHIRGRYDEAIPEYRRVLDDFPSDAAIGDEASLAIAEIELSKSAYVNALAIYERLMKKGDARGRRLSIKTSLEKARSELLGKEPAQAIKSYKAVIDMDYNEVRAHRGMIEAYAMKGEPEKAVAVYSNDIKRFPESDTAHYALGLAYTYLESWKGTVPDLRTERSGVVESGLSPLIAAELEINKALSINYSLPFAHQTLGWIYEVRDKTENRKTMGLAIDEYLTTLALFPPNDKKEISDLLLNIGNGYSALGNHDKGYEYYKRRLEAGIPFNDPKREAIFYENIGNEASRVGRYSEAVPYYMKALDYAVKIKDWNWELKINEKMALLYQEAKEYAKAADYFSQALEMAEKEKMEERKALLLRNIAYNLYQEGNTEKAIKYFNKSLAALKVKEESVEGGGLLTIKKALSLGKEGSEAFKGFEKEGEEKLIYSYLGKAYAETGEYETALNELLKKLELIPKGRETEKGIVLNNIGFLYYQTGDAENAYRYFKDSMDISGKAKNFTGEMVNIVNIGLLAAQDEATRGLSLFTITPPPSAPPLKLRGGWGELGTVPGFTEEAVKLQEKGIVLIESEKRGNEYLPYLKNNLGLLYLSSGVRGQGPGASRGGVTPPQDMNSIVKASWDSINQDRGRLKKAAEYFMEGLDALEKGKDHWLEAVLELNLATSLYRLGEEKEASSHLSLCMKLIEENSLTDLKWRGLRLLSKLDNKNRLKHLEDAVVALEGKITPPNPLFTKEGETETESLYKEAVSLLFSSGRFDDAFVYAERMAMKKVRDEAARARYPIRGTVPDLRTERSEVVESGLSPLVLSARDVQWLLDEKTAVIRYMTTDEGLLIWFIDSDTIHGRVIRIPEEQLAEWAYDFSSSLDKKEPTDRLSVVLIAPVADWLAKKKQIYIMPDPILSPIPFPALRIGKDSLIDIFELSYAPSAYLLNAAYEKRNLNKINILISQSDTYSDEYVEAVGSKIPIFAALKSDKTRFLDMASNYGIIHLTEPINVNQAAPLRSAIQFGKERLSLSELMALKMNPNLVVLTSIVPGKTITPPPSAPPLKLRGGWGELMFQALSPMILSGAPSVLVKTIPTDRESEELFMKEFYDTFRKESAAGALAKTQRKFKSQGMNPDTWAGYALYGYSGMNQEEERKYASRKVADIMNAAIESYSKGEWESAVKKFEEGLLFLKTIGAKENLGSIYQALAKASANSGDYAKGAQYQEEFIKAEGEKLSEPELAEGHKALGILYSKTGDSKKAESSMIEALRLLKKLGDKKGLAEGYRTLALLQEKGGGYQDSLASFSAALNIDKELADKASAGQDLWDMGRIYYLRLSIFDEALKSYKEALSVFNELGDNGKAAKVLMDIGLVYEQEGEYEAAKGNYLEGIRISGEANDKGAYSRGNLYLANVAWHTGDYQEAFKYQKIALAAAVELKDRKQEAMAHNLAGLTYMNLGMLEKALDSLSTSLAISIETGDKLDAAAAYNNIGIVQRELGNIEKSIEGFKNALAIDLELKTKWGMAYDMRNMGISYERMGMLNEAMENLRSSLALSREIGERKNEAMTLYSLGMLYMKTGKEKEASNTLKEAYLLGKELNLPEVTWRSLKSQASLYILGNRLSEGYTELKEAISIVERMRGRIKVDEYKSGFLENKMDLYEEMVMLLIRMGRIEEAFNYAERARSRNFIDMLGNQKVNLKSASSQRLLDRERILKGRIESLEERTKGNTALLEELAKARKDYEALLIEIKEESPELASFVTVEPPALPDIQRTIQEDAALIEYMVAKDGMVVWTLDNRRIEAVVVPITREALKEKVVRYREMMERAVPMEKESSELYNLLVRPVEKFIEGTKYIGIVPHDLLHYLSFSSLYDGKRYLMESHPIFYSPSASVLKMVIDRSSGVQEFRSSEVKLLLIGNPDLRDSAYDLPFAEREAGSIGREFEGSELLLRDKATETRIKGDIEKFNGIHFASHGVYNSATPLFSTLKLARDNANDGNFTANEVFSLNLKASLVMMSACQTGLGKLTSGDEIIGLNRAFIYAGAPSIISTLWRVNDASSAMLVKRFYRNLKNSDIAESLRLAQMAVREYYPHPAYWSGFGLTGNYK